MPGHLTKHYPENHVSVPDPLFRINASSILLKLAVPADIYIEMRQQSCKLEKQTAREMLLGSGCARGGPNLNLTGMQK